MMSKCPRCKKVTDYGPPYLVKNGKIIATDIECEPCRRKRIERKWRYSKVYLVTVTQKGYGAGRLPKNTRAIPVWFTPSISILPEGNRDYLMVDVNEYESELRFIKKGKRVKLSFYWDEFGHLKIRNIGV